MPEAKRSRTSPQITVAATNSLPADRTLVPETENETNTNGESNDNDDDDNLSDIIVVPASAIPAHIRSKSRIRGKDTPRAGTPPVGGGGILSTASRWIERVSSWHWTSPTKEQEKEDIKPERTPEPGLRLPQHEVPRLDVAVAPAPAEEEAATRSQPIESESSRPNRSRNRDRRSPSLLKIVQSSERDEAGSRKPMTTHRFRCTPIA
jgi:hypothetical protein